MSIQAAVDSFNQWKSLTFYVTKFYSLSEKDKLPFFFHEALGKTHYISKEVITEVCRALSKSINLEIKKVHAVLDSNTNMIISEDPNCALQEGQNRYYAAVILQHGESKKNGD